MATLESTIKKEGSSAVRKHFLNLKQTTRGSWYEKRRYGF